MNAAVLELIKFLNRGKDADAQLKREQALSKTNSELSTQRELMLANQNAENQRQTYGDILNRQGGVEMAKNLQLKGDIEKALVASGMSIEEASPEAGMMLSQTRAQPAMLQASSALKANTFNAAATPLQAELARSVTGSDIANADTTQQAAQQRSRILSATAETEPSAVASEQRARDAAAQASAIKDTSALAGIPELVHTQQAAERATAKQHAAGAQFNTALTLGSSVPDALAAQKAELAAKTKEANFTATTGLPVSSLSQPFSLPSQAVTANPGARSNLFQAITSAINPAANQPGTGVLPIRKLQQPLAPTSTNAPVDVTEMLLRMRAARGGK